MPAMNTSSHTLTNMSTMNTSNDIRCRKSVRNEDFKPYIVSNMSPMSTSNHILSNNVHNEYFKPYIVKK